MTIWQRLGNLRKNPKDLRFLLPSVGIYPMMTNDRRLTWQRNLDGIKKQPLGRILIASCGVQVLMVGLVGYLAQRNGDHAVRQLAGKLEAETSQRIEQHLNSYLQNARQVSQFNAEALRNGAIEPKNFTQTSQLFWHQSKSQNVGYVLYGDRTGALVSAGHYFKGEPLPVIDRIKPDPQGKQFLQTYQVNPQGKTTFVRQTTPDYRFQEEKWFATAFETKQSRWTEVYPWADVPYNLSVAITHPIFDAQGQVTAAIAVEQQLSQISEFLRAHPVSPGGRTFIMERSGLLIASSGQEAPYRLQQNKPQRLSALDSQDSIVRSVAQKLSQDGLQQITQTQTLEYADQNDRLYVQVNPWRDPLGLDWLVVVVVPEADFMGEIQAQGRLTAGLCLLAFGLASLLGWLTYCWVTRPIQQLQKATDRLTHQSAWQTVPIDCQALGGVAELDALGQSFNLMADRLQQAFGDLERTNATLESRVEERTQAYQTALDELKQTQAKLIQTEKMSSLSQLVAGVAHEINNPVTFIAGNVKYVQGLIGEILSLLQAVQGEVRSVDLRDRLAELDLDFLQADLPKVLASMHHGADRITAIVLSLRNFSRLDEAELKGVDLHEGLHSTLLLLDHQRQAKGITLVETYGDLPQVHCYPGSLNQVFTSILQNALDALSSTETPQISIETWCLDENHVAIALQNNGPAIPASIQAKIFDPFFTTKPVGSGTGMGLAISQQIITQHGGTLEVASAPDQGVRFVISLPIDRNRLNLPQLHHMPIRVLDKERRTA
jgi:signal transduction histidine kinase